MPMAIFRNPAWINRALLEAESLDHIPAATLAQIGDRIRAHVSFAPEVSVVISAWNEELNIVRCLDSLSRSQTNVPFEIIVVNNNSTDRTQEVLDAIGIPNYFQPVQGVGPSRELGQRMAKGRYVLSADADCIYPARWIDIMTRTLMTPGTVFVYGRFSYLSNKDQSRWQLFLYEKARDLMSEIRHLKRPYLNSYGISLGYVRELGLKEGHVEKNVRGFDGRLCFDMMKYGKVRMVRSSRAKAWTGTRALTRDGSFSQAILKRVLKEFARFEDYLTRPRDHNTKDSPNRDYSIRKSVESIKKKFNPWRFFKK
jgi:glycosyltransferase involved in cell wall biosynthesis